MSDPWPLGPPKAYYKCLSESARIGSFLHSSAFQQRAFQNPSAPSIPASIQKSSKQARRPVEVHFLENTGFSQNFCISQFSISVTKSLRSSAYKEKRFILAHSFRGLSSQTVGSIVLGLWQDTKSQQGKLLTSWWMGHKEKRKRKGLVSKTPPKVTTQWPNFLPLHPPPKGLPSVNSITGWRSSLGDMDMDL